MWSAASHSGKAFSLSVSLGRCDKYLNANWKGKTCYVISPVLTGAGYHSLLPAAACAGVRRLDLAGVYWISPDELLTKLICMSNLTHLAVQDVRFTSRQFNTLLNKLNRLSSLSFSWTWTSQQEAEEVSSPAAPLVRLNRSPQYPVTG